MHPQEGDGSSQQLSQSHVKNRNERMRAIEKNMLAFYRANKVLHEDVRIVQDTLVKMNQALNLNIQPSQLRTA